MTKDNLRMKYQILLIIILSIIFGFAAGLLGELWINDFLRTGKTETQKIQTLTERLDQLTERQDKKLKDILAEKDLSVSQTIDNVRPAIVSFYTDRKQTNTWNDILMPQNFVGVGTIITADGWILTDRSVVSDQTSKLAVTFENEVYDVESYVCDTATNACFAKIEAADLPVIDLTSREFLTNGQTALVISLNEIYPTTIESLYYSPIKVRSDYVHSSEEFYKTIKLNDQLDEKWLGAPVVNLNGQVFGFLSTDNVVFPIDNIQNIMRQAIAGEQIARSVLGLHYIDLTEAVGWEEFTEQKQGALIFGIEGKPAILVNSPAQKAGLLANDIIISVDDDPVNENNSLSSLIQSYKAADEIKLKVLRGEEEIEVDVTLTQ